MESIDTTDKVSPPHIEALFNGCEVVDEILIVLNDLNYEYSKCMWRVSVCDVGGWEVYDFSEGSPVKIYYGGDTPLPAWMGHKIAVLDMLPIGSDLVDGVGYRPTYGLYWLEKDDG